MSQRGKVKRARVAEDDNYGEGSSTQRSRVSDNFESSQFGGTDWASEETDRLVKAVVRYALACEFNKKVIRRDDINKKILKDKTRMFHPVMNKAKQRLRTVFGMTLAELPAPAKNPLHSQVAATQTQTQVSSSQRGGGSGSASTGTFILQNILKEDYNIPMLIDRSDDEYIHTGVLYVILGLIFASEHQILTSELYSHLDRLRVAQSSKTFGSREELISSFVKQRYLVKTKISEQEGDEPDYMLTWGARAKVELPEQNIVEFMTGFYNFSTPQLKQEFKNNLYKAAGFDIPS